MFAQVILVLGLQIAAGRIYTWIAAMVAAYMLGTGLAALGTARLRMGRTGVIAVHLVLVALPVTAAGLVRTGPAGTVGAAILAVASLGVGAVGGFAFALLAGLRAGLLPPERRGALTYALDLAGACTAGFAGGFLLIPALGMLRAALAVSLAATLLLPLSAAFVRAGPTPRLR
jgi:hypothetical protein